MIVTDLALNPCFGTVTRQVSFFPATFAVIFALPGATAVTSPSEDTLATDGLLLDHRTLFVVLRTCRSTVFPKVNVIFVLFNFGRNPACALVENCSTTANITTTDNILFHIFFVIYIPPCPSFTFPDRFSSAKTHNT